MPRCSTSRSGALWSTRSAAGAAAAVRRSSDSETAWIADWSMKSSKFNLVPTGTNHTPRDAERGVARISTVEGTCVSATGAPGGSVATVGEYELVIRPVTEHHREGLSDE